jgi:hypothetical protein
MTQKELLRGVIDRLKSEGDLIRNSGTNSMKSIKEAMLDDLPSKLKDSILSSNDDSIGTSASSPVPSTGDDLEAQRDEKQLFEDMRDSLETIAQNTSGGVNAVASGGGIGSALSGAGSGLGSILKGAGGGIGLAGLGIGAAFAGGAVLVNQVTELMKSFDDLADGIEKLNNTPVSVEQFEKIGSAINALVSGTSIGGAIGLRILQGTAFTDLADGITELNNVQFDPVQLENVAQGLSSLVGSTGILSSGGFALLAETDFKSLSEGLNALGAITVDPKQLAMIGEGINAMLDPLSASDIGEASVLATIDDNLGTVADAVQQINGLNIDGSFVDRMSFIGEGINSLLEPLSASDIGEAAVLQAIDDNLGTIADGANRLNTVDGNLFALQGTLLGQGFGALLDGMDDLLGASGMQMIDDNLGAVADGVKYFSSVVTPEIASAFENQSIVLGRGFQALLDGTDDLFGAGGMQMIDDNIMPVADGVKYFTGIVTPEMAKSFSDTSIVLGRGFQALLDGTDDLLGAQGMQMIDDNLLPLADGVRAIDEVGRDIDLANFDKISTAIDKINNISSKIEKINFAPAIEADMNIRGIASQVEDLRSLMSGLAQGGEQEFNGLGVLGFGNSIDFGKGILDPELKLDELRNAIGKIQEVAGGLLGEVRIDPIQTDMNATIEKPEQSPREILREYFTNMQNENEDMKATAQSSPVNVVAPNTSVTNNNSQTAAVMDKNVPTVDYNDRTYVSDGNW